MASQPTITKFLALFQELYPTRELTDMTGEAWGIALSDVDDQTFTWAAQRILKEGGRTFFPTPNEIRAYVHNPERTIGRLPSNDPVAKGIDTFYTEQAKTSKRLTAKDASA
jgi:hypothetical protein